MPDDLEKKTESAPFDPLALGKEVKEFYGQLATMDKNTSRAGNTILRGISNAPPLQQKRDARDFLDLLNRMDPAGEKYKRMREKYVNPYMR